MNKKTKSILAVIAACLIIAAIVLAVKVRGNSVREDGLVINAGGKTVNVSLKDLNRTSFSGEIVNGKGEVSSHEYKGIELNVLLNEKGIEVSEDAKITVSSEDNYTAELSGSEILKEGTVYIAVECDGEKIEGIEGTEGARLVVYGDANSKRQVRYLKTITME